MAIIGEEFRRERQNKGLSLNDVAQVLHIRPDYLAAIEDDQFKVIPGSVFVKGFIRNYAILLGLDPTRMVNAYKLVMGEEIITSVRTIQRKHKKPKEEDDDDCGLERRERLSYDGRLARRRKEIRKERIIVSIFLVIFTFFLLWLFFY